MNSNWGYSPETPNLGQIRRFLEPCDLEIWRMTLKNNRAPLLCCFQLCAWFHCHMWIWPWKTIGHLYYATSSSMHHFIAIGEFKLELQSRNAQFGSKSMILSRVTLQFDVWPWKMIGHLFYATSSFVHHFVAIGDFKLELQSGNAQFGSNSTIFRAVWPWNLTDDLEKQ